MNKKGPIRTCVSCKKRKEKKELVRFVSGLNNELIADVKFKLPGRGASVCFNLDCLKNAVKKKKLKTALKNSEITCDFSCTLNILKKSYEDYFYNLLKVGFGGKNICDGLDSCIEEIKKKNVFLNIIPIDIGKDSLKKIENFINLYSVKTIFIGTKAYFSELFNKPLRSMYCVTDELFADKLCDIYEKISLLKDWMEQEVPCNG